MSPLSSGRPLVITQWSCGLGSEWDSAYRSAVLQVMELRDVEIADQRYVGSQLKNAVVLAVRVVKAGAVDPAADVTPLLSDHQRQIANPTLSLLTVVAGRGAVRAKKQIEEVMGAAPDGSWRWVETVQTPEELVSLLFNQLMMVIDTGCPRYIDGYQSGPGDGGISASEVPITVQRVTAPKPLRGRP